jgi:hypothetical protein
MSPIIKGEAILSDGKPYYFRVNERNLNERLLFLSSDSVIYSVIDDLVKTYGLDIKTTAILLASEEINTVYFSNKLLKKYPNVKGIGPSDNLDAMKVIFFKIADSGYLVQPITPNISPVLPDIKELKDIPEAVKPGLPPVKAKEPEKPIVKLPPALPPKRNTEFINLPPLPSNMNLNILIGKVGTITSKVSPTGKVEINNITYEAIAEKNEIDVGTKVKVFGVSGKKYLQVEKVALPPLPPKKNSIT